MPKKKLLPTCSLTSLHEPPILIHLSVPFLVCYLAQSFRYTFISGICCVFFFLRLHCQSLTRCFAFEATLARGLFGFPEANCLNVAAKCDVNLHYQSENEVWKSTHVSILSGGKCHGLRGFLCFACKTKHGNINMSEAHFLKHVWKRF